MEFVRKPALRCLEQAPAGGRVVVAPFVRGDGTNQLGSVVVGIMVVDVVVAVNITDDVVLAQVQAFVFRLQEQVFGIAQNPVVENDNRCVLGQ